uniref:Tenascin-R-like n=1 Tax=Phallusia mammillata TaxID=59560 RepID=A0A6F9DUN6_9ASCI|nr:tenascin-R-like [Phallusia mammillata]
MQHRLGAKVLLVDIVLVLCQVLAVKGINQIESRHHVPEPNATLHPTKPLVFNHKYSINIPGNKLCKCPPFMQGGVDGDNRNENSEEFSFETSYDTALQNGSDGFVHVNRGYVTPSQYDVDEHGRPYADLFHFDHRIEIPHKKCLCEGRDLQKLKLQNKNLRAELSLLEKTFLKRIKAVERQLKNQGSQKCRSCQEEPLLDIIQGTEEDQAVIEVSARGYCPLNCSGNGACVDGLCKCRPGFIGKDCSKSRCPNACSGHGNCDKHGKCKCWGKWTEKDCSERACTKDCNGNGVCQNGKCICNKDYTGRDCSVAKCINSCSKHGKCVKGQCQCQVLWTGEDCSVKRCPRNCSGHGSCQKGKCNCDEPWAGKACNIKRCLNDCNLNGRCRNGTCHCTNEWSGEDCNTLRCPSDCSGFGTCHNGTCNCQEGWTGNDCTILHCPDMCSNNGRCVNHLCVCDDGWEGLNCASLQSPSNLQVTNVQPTTIDISWSPSLAKITGNQVNCIPMSGTANAVYQSVSPNVTKVTIRDLDSGTQYSVFVYAMVEDALSTPITASVKTAVDAPSTLSWLRIGPTFVEISWSPAKAKIDRYKVVCSCKQGGAEFSVLPNKTSVLIKDLRPGDTYTVALYAVQGVDVSEPININFTTSLDAPEDIEFINVTATSAVTQWSRSKASVDGYEITFLEADVNNAEPISKKVPSSSNQLILSGLKPDTQHNVTLIAYRNDMRSLPLNATLIAGIESPHHVHVTRLSHDSVTLRWTSPNEKIKQFRIKVSTREDFDTGPAPLVDTILPETINHATFGDLLPGTEHVIQLYSIDGKRESGALLKFFVTGVDAPSNLRPVEITPTSLTVEWKASEADVESYTLNCRDVVSGITHELRIDATDNLRATFSALQALNRYNISVRADSGQSSSEMTSITQLTALPTPNNLDVVMPTYEDLLITWNPVIGLAETGFMGLYNVTVINPTMPDPIEFLVPGSNTEILVPNISPGLIYNISLKAQSNNPRVPPSPPAQISFISPVDPPTGVTVSMVGYNNATVYWNQVTAPITGYLIEYRDFDETVDKISLQLSANQTYVTLDDLSDDTTYIVNVTAVMHERFSKQGTAILTTDIMLVEPPELLRVVEVTWDKIEIEWMTSITESVQAYLVTCTTSNSMDSDRNITVSKDETSAVMTSLLPGTLYQLNVYALLQHRFSTPAQIAVRTALDAPRDLMFVTVSDQSFTIHWMAPYVPVTSYLMTYYRSDVEDERADVDISGTSSVYSIHRLEPATDYTVELYSVANGSQSLPTVAMVITLPSPVTRLRSIKQGVNTIVITWSPPDRGEITGYEISYHPVGDTESQRKTELTNDKTRYTLRDLTPATFYRITMQSKRALDSSEARTITQGTMIPAVKSLRTQPLDDARVTVSWNAPPGVAVQGYRISHRSLDDLADYVTKTVSRDATTSTVTGLTADTQYSIQVTPMVDGLVGKTRQAKATTGSQLESPEQLHVTNIRDTSAEVTWDAVNDKTITGYLVTYKPLGDSTEDATEKTVLGRKRTSLMLMSLHPATVHYVTLATLRHGLVSYPPAHQRFLTAAILTPPTDVKVCELTETTIGLEWTTQKSEQVQEYHVTYSSMLSGRTSEIIQAGDDVSQILIEDLQSGHSYRVNIRSFRWGTDSAKDVEVNVTTLYRLLPPKSMSIINKTQTEALITWQSSTPDAEEYDVNITSQLIEGNPIQLRVASTEVAVDNLIPGTSYTVSVSTRRAGKLSKAETVTLVTDERLDPPTNITIELIGESGARLNWALPEQNYDATWLGHRSDDGLEGNITRLDVGVTSYRLGSLRPDTLYHVWLTSSLKSRESVEERTSFTTDYIIPPPASLRFSDVTETSLTLNWRRTSDRARYFRVVCRSEDGDIRTITVSGIQTELPMRSLQSATTYNLTVHGLGKGRESQPLFGYITTLLGAVRKLSVTEVTSESVHLTWRPPVGIVNRYDVVYYEEGDSSNPTALQVVNKTYHNVTGLFPGTQYIFQIVAYKKTQRSLSSLKPVETKLDPPSIVRTSEISRRTANVTWQPARAKHVTGYHVTVVAVKNIFRREYNVTGTLRHIWLRHLLPNTNYVVSVRTRRGDDASVADTTRFKTGTVPFPKPKDCAEILLNGDRTNGVYTVFFDHGSETRVQCDLRTDGGGWMVVQRRINGKEDFDRDWEDYLNGFGEEDGEEFWIGLRNMHLLTRHPQELRIDLRHKSQRVHAIYSDVTISDEQSGYVISGGHYHGDAGDSMSYHFGMKFTTKDVDNDLADNRNCAAEYGGAWWFRNCHRSSLNGQYNNTRHSQGINWFTWGGFTRSIEFVEMKMRPKSLRSVRKIHMQSNERRPSTGRG